MDMDKPISLRLRLGIKNVRNRLRKSGLHRFGGGSGKVWGGIAHGAKSLLIDVEGNMTVVMYRVEILCPVAVSLVQQRQLILLQDNAGHM